MSNPASNVTPLRRPIPDAAPYLEHIEPASSGAEPTTNLASYGVQAAFSFTGMALRHLHSIGAPVTEQIHALLAETFAMIVADVQYELVNTTRMQHGLNPRLRGLLATILDTSPFPLGEPLSVVQDWVIATKTGIWIAAKHAIDLHDRQDVIRHSTAYHSLASA